MAGKTSRSFRGPLKHRLRTSIFDDEVHPAPRATFIGNRESDLGFEPASDLRKRQAREARKRGPSAYVPHEEIAHTTSGKLFKEKPYQLKESEIYREPSHAQKLAQSRAELQASYKARFL